MFASSDVKKYGSLASREDSLRDRTLRAELKKSIEEYAKNLPLSVKIFCQSDKEKARVAAYAAHLTHISEIHLPQEVFAHIQGTKPRPCEMNKEFCDTLRESLCHYFGVNHVAIIRSQPSLLTRAVAASSYANTGFLAERDYYDARDKLLEKRINVRELINLGDREESSQRDEFAHGELGDVAMRNVVSGP